MNKDWEKIKHNLAHSVKSGIFDLWIKPLQGEIQDKTLFLTAPNTFVASWVKERLLEKIKEVAADSLGYRPEIQIDGQNGHNGPLKYSSSPMNSTSGQLYLPLNSQQEPPSCCNWQYCFEDFVIGECNRLAHAACSTLCCSRFDADNLFLCSGPGLGKTHLLQATGNYLSSQNKDQNYKIAYLSSEKFASRMVQAIKTKQIDSFKENFRKNLDLLLLEDIHFFQGKAKMQEELLSLIKELENRGKKVAFSSSFLPKELDKVDSQLSSYFCSGLLAPIQSPEYDLRLRLIKIKARKLQIHIPQKISKLIASNIRSDIRQLGSCLHSLALKARLHQQDITQDLAEEVLKNYTHNEKTIDMDKIVNLVSQCFELPISKLKSKSRKKDIVVARNSAFYLARKHTDLSLKDIGAHFNRRHSTVLKGITNLEKEVKKDTIAGRQIKRISKRLEA